MSSVASMDMDEWRRRRKAASTGSSSGQRRRRPKREQRRHDNGLHGWQHSDASSVGSGSTRPGSVTGAWADMRDEIARTREARAASAQKRSARRGRSSRAPSRGTAQRSTTGRAGAPITALPAPDGGMMLEFPTSTTSVASSVASHDVGLGWSEGRGSAAGHSVGTSSSLHQGRGQRQTTRREAGDRRDVDATGATAARAAPPPEVLDKDLMRFLQQPRKLGTRAAVTAEASQLVASHVPHAEAAHNVSAARALAALQMFVQLQDWPALVATVQGTRLSARTCGLCAHVVQRASECALMCAPSDSGGDAPSGSKLHSAPPVPAPGPLSPGTSVHDTTRTPAHAPEATPPTAASQGGVSMPAHFPPSPTQLSTGAQASVPSSGASHTGTGRAAASPHDSPPSERSPGPSPVPQPRTFAPLASPPPARPTRSAGVGGGAGRATTLTVVTANQDGSPRGANSHGAEQGGAADGALAARDVSPSLSHAPPSSDTSSSPTGGTYFLPRPSRVAASRVVVHTTVGMDAAARRSMFNGTAAQAGGGAPLLTVSAPVPISHSTFAVVTPPPAVAPRSRRRRRQQGNATHASAAPPVLPPSAAPALSVAADDTQPVETQPIPDGVHAVETVSDATRPMRGDDAPASMLVGVRDSIVEDGGVLGVEDLATADVGVADGGDGGSIVGADGGEEGGAGSERAAGRDNGRGEEDGGMRGGEAAVGAGGGTPGSGASVPRAPLLLSFPVPSPSKTNGYKGWGPFAPLTSSRGTPTTATAFAAGASEPPEAQPPRDSISEGPPASVATAQESLFAEQASVATRSRSTGGGRKKKAPHGARYHGDSLLKRQLRRNRETLLVEALSKELSGTAGYVSEAARRKVEGARRAIIQDRLLRLDAFYMNYVDKAKEKKARKQERMRDALAKVMGETTAARSATSPRPRRAKRTPPRTKRRTPAAVGRTHSRHQEQAVNGGGPQHRGTTDPSAAGSETVDADSCLSSNDEGSASPYAVAAAAAAAAVATVTAAGQARSKAGVGSPGQWPSAPHPTA